METFFRSKRDMKKLKLVFCRGDLGLFHGEKISVNKTVLTKIVELSTEVLRRSKKVAIFMGLTKGWGGFPKWR